ncbi:MAG TPA: hypothetical protein P5232_01790 [Candidatus Moranbacteria bacterium]|nr:hypothetical protein [Candidatus Moranbacteria bacterium]
MPTIEFDLVIHRFKKGKKTKMDYDFPAKIYVGTIKIDEKEKAIDYVLKAKKGILPIMVCWNADNEIFCIAKRKEGDIRFILPTQLPTGEPRTKFSICGQTVDKGKFTNWSAYMEVFSIS